jgi:ribosomal protein S27AE
MNPTTFTDKQLKTYYKNLNACPGCGSENIEAGHFEYKEDGGYVSVTCGKCGLEWNDLYKHVGAGERYFTELESSNLEKIDPDPGYQGCWEFTFKGVGWGDTVDEALESCVESMHLEEINVDDVNPVLIDQEKASIAKTCDQCTWAYIQNVFCHEKGCPNEKKVWNYEEDVWEDKPIEDESEE